VDAIRWISENRIADAIADGLFDDLPPMGPIDCSLSGERFFADWFAKRLAHEDALPANWFVRTECGRCADDVSQTDRASADSSRDGR
jgi:hypothetical protein